MFILGPKATSLPVSHLSSLERITVTGQVLRFQCVTRRMSGPEIVNAGGKPAGSL
jgi:hypothetical protein